MSLAVYDIDVLKRPQSMNNGGGGSRVHWAVAHQSKRAWEEILQQEFMVARVRRGAVHVQVDVTLHWKRKDNLDTPNYFPDVIKPLADACVKFGLIADDADQFFTVGRFVSDYPDPWPLAGRLSGFISVHLEAEYA